MAGSGNWKNQGMPSYPFRFYWKKLDRAQHDVDRCRILHNLIQKATLVRTAVVTPEYAQIVQSLLEGSHGDEVKLLTLRLITCYIPCNLVMLLFIDNGLLNAVAAIMDVKVQIDEKPTGTLKYHLLCEAIHIAMLVSEKNLKLVLKHNIHRKLMNFLDQNNSKMFNLGSEGCSALERLTADKELIGDCRKCVAADTKTICKKFFPPVDIQTLVIPKELYEINLYDTSDPEKDCNILDEMKSLGVVWPKVSEQEAERGPGDGANISHSSTVEEPEEEESWQDVVVTKVISADYFWAHVGMEAGPAVQEVKEILTNWPQKSRQMLKAAPRTGVFVAAPSSKDGVFRAQVLDVRGDDVRLFALDYGAISVSPWKSCFLLTPDMNMKRFPPQAKLCRLKDAYPPPASEDLFGRVLNCLLRLTGYINYTAKYFTDVTLYVSVVNLLRVPSTSLKSKVVVLVTNLATTDNMRIELAKYGVLHSCVDLVVMLLDQKERNEQDMELLKLTLQAITNLLFQCNSNKAKFAEEMPGLQCLIKFCRNKELEEVAAKALKVFMGNVNLTSAVSMPNNPEPVEHRRARSTERRGHSSSGSRSRSRGGVRSEETARSRSKSRSRREVEWETDVTGQLPMQALQMAESSDDEPGPGNVVLVSSKSAEGTTSQSEGEQLPCEPSRVPDPSGSDVVHYDHGDTFPYKADEMHHFMTQRKLEQIRDENLAVVVISILNTSMEGSIYVGVTEDGFVQGVPSSRDDRDGMRIGLDHLMMDRITPRLLHSQYKVLFHPVLQHNKTIAHVAELKLKVSQKVFYKTQGKMYIRKGNEIQLFSVTDFHQACIQKEEEAALMKLNLLKLELEQLRKLALN